MASMKHIMYSCLMFWSADQGGIATEVCLFTPIVMMINTITTITTTINTINTITTRPRMARAPGPRTRRSYGQFL